jgi:glutamate racemase
MIMTLTMPQTRKVIRKQEAIAAELKQALKAKGVTRHSQREKLMRKAASSRPADITEQARKSLRERRVQRDLDMIAGRL